MRTARSRKATARHGENAERVVLLHDARSPSVGARHVRVARGHHWKGRRQLGAIDLVSADRKYKLRDVTLSAIDSGHAGRIIAAVETDRRFEVSTVSDRTFLLHLGGKIVVENHIVPSVFDRRVASAVSKAVARAAIRTGVARRGSQTSPGVIAGDIVSSR